MSIESIKKKMDNGAELTHFLPNKDGRGGFVTLKYKNKKGEEKCWFLEESAELLRLDHRFVPSSF
jgi:hypothetical protein